MCGRFCNPTRKSPIARREEFDPKEDSAGPEYLVHGMFRGSDKDTGGDDKIWMTIER